MPTTTSPTSFSRHPLVVGTINIEKIRRISCLLGLCLFSLNTTAPAQDRQVQPGPTAQISWTKQTTATSYRIQIASDELFNDILFDGLVSGNQYVVKDLPVGRYYWRVAVSGSGSPKFQKATQFFVSFPKPIAKPSPQPSAPVLKIDNSVRTRIAVPGWYIATGEIVQLSSAQLRRGTTTDFLGVNSEGKLYALDGVRGVPLWTANYKVSSPGDERVRVHYNRFSPLIIPTRDAAAQVLVAFDRGARALNAGTGQEVWSTRIAGYPRFAAVIENSIYLIGEKLEKLFVLDSTTGQLRSTMTLRDGAVGPPVELTNGETRQLLIPLKNGLIELRTFEGKYARSFKLASEATTQPLVVKTRRGNMLLIGIKNGLAAFDASSLQPLGTISLEAGDSPIGAPSVVDLDADSFPEIVMSTSGSKVMSINVADGKIRWSAKVDAESTLAFADLDGDAKLDVVLPGKDNFAVGLSGLSGSIIWTSGETMSRPNNLKPTGRSLAVATVTDGRLLVVGSDASSAGLRALEVQRAPVKTNP